VRTNSTVPGVEPDTLVAWRAAESHGVLSLDELFACGLTRKGVEVRVAQGHLHRIHRGVFAVGHPGLTQEGVWLAAVKAAGPGALLSHTPAAMHYGILPLEDHLPAVTVTSGAIAASRSRHRSG
jgi:hypothetical protein